MCHNTFIHYSNLLNLCECVNNVYDIRPAPFRFPFELAICNLQPVSATIGSLSNLMISVLCVLIRYRNKRSVKNFRQPNRIHGGLPPAEDLENGGGVRAKRSMKAGYRWSRRLGAMSLLRKANTSDEMSGGALDSIFVKIRQRDQTHRNIHIYIYIYIYKPALSS